MPLTHEQKKGILKAGIFSLILLTIFYLYLTGSIYEMRKNLDQTSKNLEIALLEKSALEKQWIKDNNELVITNLLLNGYQTPQNLVVVKKNINVATEKRSIY